MNSHSVLVLKRLVAALLLSVSWAPSTAAAEAMTWQEANQRSAALIREHGHSKEAADLALASFNLYEAQSHKYTARSHAQLLLNAVDARLQAEDPRDALKDLEGGAGKIASRAGADEPVLLDIWLEAIRICKKEGGCKRVHRYIENASRLADKVWSPEDPRAIKLLIAWVNESSADRGYGWALPKLKMARERAAKAGEESALVSGVDLSIAKLELQGGFASKAIALYSSLIERLARIADPEQALLLQLAYAQLEYAYEKNGNTAAAKEVRERRNRDLPAAAELIPTVRVPPQYPYGAARREGRVVVQITVAADGTVAALSVLESDPPGVFDEAALDALRRWKFKPKTVDGTPVQQVGLQPIEFKMAR